MATEAELKYAVADAQTLSALECDAQVCAARLGPVAVMKMESVYFDAPSGALSARKWTLRLRRENARTVVTCKTAGTVQGGLLTRGEWQCAASSVTAAIPALIAQGAPAQLEPLTAAGVIALCGAEFTRRAGHLRFADGSEAELALDFGVLTGGGKTLALCELELELLSGAPTAMLQLATDLADRYALRSESKSKFLRALALT